MSAIRELYQQVILDHNKSPRNYHAMPDATRAVDGYNPLCGDHYKVYVRIDNDIIRDISFEGAGCAISKASASVMSSMVKGKTVQEAESLFGEFHRLVTGKPAGDDDIERLGKLAAFAGVSEYPARVKCASLAWHTMHSALSSHDASVSTE
jgi:nitrogen fixation NifU-like protein